VLRATILYDEGIGKIDVIEHDSKLWLVPVWNEIPEKKSLVPAIMIRLDTLRHSGPHQKGDTQYTVNNPIPMSALRGEPTVGYEVVLEPNILVPDPKFLH